MTRSYETTPNPDWLLILALVVLFGVCAHGIEQRPRANHFAATEDAAGSVRQGAGGLRFDAGAVAHSVLGEGPEHAEALQRNAAKCQADREPESGRDAATRGDGAARAACPDVLHAHSAHPAHAGEARP